MSNNQFMPATADSLARLHTAEAVGTIVDIMRTGKPNERMRAAETLLERGHGKAVQAVITVPARQAVSARLAAMDDAALLAIASAGRITQEAKGDGPGGGSTPQNEGPQGPVAETVPYKEAPTAFVPKGNSDAPVALRNADIVDAEYVIEDTDSKSAIEDMDYDPTI